MTNSIEPDVRSGKMTWLTEQECSELTKIPVRTLRDWRYKRLNIPFVKIGALVRYDEATVNAYMRSQEVAVTS